MEQYNQNEHYENIERGERNTRNILIVLSIVVLAIALIFILVGLKVIDFGFLNNMGIGYTYNNSDRYLVGSNEVLATDISEIDINWIAGNVNVEAYDGDKIIFSEADNLPEEFQLRYIVENGRLTIKYMKSGTFNFSLESKTLAVKIPKDAKPYSMIRIKTVSAAINAGNFTSDEVTLETVSGRVDFISVTCNLLKVKSVSGRINILESVSEDFNVENVSGTVNFSGNADKIKAETVSGRVNVSSFTCPHTVGINSTSGDITLSIPENNGFEVRIETVSGSFSCDFPTTLKDKKHIYKTGDADFRFETVSGDVSIIKIAEQS